MSAWDIYWVMQADSFRSGVISAFLGCIVGCPACYLISCFIRSEMDWSWNQKEAIQKRMARQSTFASKLGTRLLILSIPVGVISALAPSTKTVAAMLTIPMVANNETIQADATEIYQLGMERLKEVLGDEDTEPTK